MNAKSLLSATAWIEAAAGGALLVAPTLTAEILLGEGLSSPAAFAVARVAAFALLALAVACWLGRNCERRAQTALVAGMLVYNLGVPVVLVHGWMASALRGLALWPASVLHVALAIWCIVCLRANR